MQGLSNEARSFRARSDEAVAEAKQRVALQILCGVNLDEALEAPNERRDALVQRIERALKTERIKGLRNHWSYDLNRHIALKQALERFKTIRNCSGGRHQGKD